MKDPKNLVACSCIKTCLDLGCGTDITPEFADGIDIVNFGQKYVHDIDNEKWPIPDETYDSIHAWNVVEHIYHKLFVINEAWRVLKKGGIMEIVTPDFMEKHELALCDPTHVSLWVKGTFTQYFCGTRGTNSDIKKWELIECRNYDEVNHNLILCKMKKPI